MKALASILAATALVAVAGAAAAHDPGKTKVRTIVVHNDGEGGRNAHVMVHGAKCEEAAFKSDVDVETPAEGGKKQRTRVLVCNSDADPAKARAHVLEALTKARANIAEHESERLTTEHRAKALAALDREIARLRGQ